MHNYLKTAMFFLCFTLTSVPHFVAAKEHVSNFTREQQMEIGRIALDYLFEHPEYLDQLVQRRQDQCREKYTKKIASITNKAVENKSVLLANTPQIDFKDATVALVEFYDYQCSFCSKMAPVIKQTVQNYPQLRLILKDWPAFDDRWPTSETAAAIGITLWQDKGEKIYLDYHYRLFKTNHTEGQLQVEDIAHVLNSIGMPVPTPEAMVKSRLILRKNSQLAKKLGLTQLPTFIVMPLERGTKMNTTVLVGETSVQEFQAAILKAQQ